MTRTRAIASAILAAALVLAAVTPASAADLPTRIAFTGEGATVATFDSDWEIPVAITSGTDGVVNNVSSNDGTVDFLVAGKPGAYVAGAKIYPGGVAYFTQPATVAPLGVGEYTVTAVFVPAAGSDFVTSKTSKSVKLTITPLEVAAAVSVITDPATVAVPTVRTSLSGTYLDETGAPPRGQWTVTGSDSSGAEVFVVTAAQPTESADGPVGPFDIPITDQLEPGETFTVTTVFEPEASIADGLEFVDAAPTTFTTRSLTPTEVLSSPVVVAPWVAILNGLLFIVLIIGLVWLIGAWVRGRTPRGASTQPQEAPIGETAVLTGLTPPAALTAGDETEAPTGK